MSFSFSSIGHFFASVAQELVHVTKIVTPVVAKIESSEATVEALSGLIYPEAVPLERGAYALLGMAAHAVQTSGDAATANGLNLVLDSQLVAEIKAIIPALEAYAQQMGITKPAVTTPVATIAKAVVTNSTVASVTNPLGTPQVAVAGK